MADIVRVLVCGGRDLDEFQVFNRLKAELHEVLDDHLVGYPREITIIHGGALGADEGAKRWAESENARAICFKADWKKHGKAAGPMRNQRMIDEGKPDIVVAFPGGRGTADMIRRAEAAGIRAIKLTEIK